MKLGVEEQDVKVLPHMIVDLTEENQEAGGIVIGHTYFTFPDGATHFYLKKPKEIYTDTVLITAAPRTNDDIMKLLFCVNALKEDNPVVGISLLLKWLPYARQDRITRTGEVNSLKVVAQLLNSCNFEIVHLVHPHSEVASSLINNCAPYIPYGSIIKAIESIRKSVEGPIKIVSPDAGAYKWVFEIYNKLIKEDGQDLDGLLIGMKHRNTLNGQIDRITIMDAEQAQGANCIIIDDICDAGGTFKGLHKVLKENGAKTIHLYTTHGLYTRGLENLEEFDSIHTTDTVVNPEIEVPKSLENKFFILDHKS